MSSAKVSDTGKALWILYFLNPFASFLYVMSNMGDKYFVPIVTAFCGFYGFTFVPQRETMDSFRHRARFVDWANLDVSVESVFTMLYDEEGRIVDLFLPLLNFLLSRFTANPHVLYLFLGLFFGFLLSSNLKFIRENIKSENPSFVYLLCLVFFFIIGPWEINSLRFWLAAHLYFFALIPYLLNRKKSKLIFIFFTPFIHFSFFLPLAIFCIYFLLGNRIRLYFYFFLFALLFGNADINLLRTGISYLGINAIENRSENYIRASEVQMEEAGKGNTASKRNTLNWYVTWRTKPFKWMTFLFVILIYYLKIGYIIKYKRLKALLSFALLILGLSVLFMEQIPQFGRFYRLALLFLLAFYILFFSRVNTYSFRFVKLPYILAIAFFLIVETRIALDTFTIDAFVSNPLFSIVYLTETPTINIIKDILL